MTAEPAVAPRGWLLWLVAGTGIIAVASALEFHPPRTLVVPVVGVRLPPMCSAERLLGIDCPGCGLTRSFVLAAHGQWSTAFAMHPAGTLAFLLLVLQIPLRLWQGWQAWSGRPVLRTGSAEAATAVVVVAATILWWIVKIAPIRP